MADKVFVLFLTIAFLVLFYFVVRPPNAPLYKYFIFVLWLIDAVLLVFMFAILVFKYNPNPLRLRIAHALTYNKLIDLTQIVPGLYDLNYISRINADDDQPQEWLAFYQYDVKTVGEGNKVTRLGPYGAAIYDPNRCRPPAIPSYELAPVSYDYLGQDGAWPAVENMIEYKDPLSGGMDRAEILIHGLTYNVVTDLNIFRKVGTEPDCLQVQDWLNKHPGQPFPYGDWLRYDNIGSFRGNYMIRRDRSTITVVDRAGFERSQFTVESSYKPLNGSYLKAGTQTLLDPVEVTLAFGPGEPDQISQVYYPEKTVLAFYKSLTQDTANLARAKSYLSDGAQKVYNINTDPFGLSTDPASVAQARDKLARVLVWQIQYQPDIEAERLHKDRHVTAVVVGVDKDGNIDRAHPCYVTWRIIGVPNPNALPYGCEWRLDGYQSTCLSGELGENDSGGQLVGRITP